MEIGRRESINGGSQRRDFLTLLTAQNRKLTIFHYLTASCVDVESSVRLCRLKFVLLHLNCYFNECVKSSLEIIDFQELVKWAPIDVRRTDSPQNRLSKQFNSRSRRLHFVKLFNVCGFALSRVFCALFYGHKSSGGGDKWVRHEELAHRHDSVVFGQSVHWQRKKCVRHCWFFADIFRVPLNRQTNSTIRIWIIECICGARN